MMTAAVPIKAVAESTPIKAATSGAHQFVVGQILPHLVARSLAGVDGALGEDDPPPHEDTAIARMMTGEKLAWTLASLLQCEQCARCRNDLSQSKER